MHSKLVTELTERSASTAFVALDGIHVDNEVTRKLLLGIFEKKVPQEKKLSARLEVYKEDFASDREDDSQREKLSAFNDYRDSDRGDSYRQGIGVKDRQEDNKAMEELKVEFKPLSDFSAHEILP